MSCPGHHNPAENQHVLCGVFRALQQDPRGSNGHSSGSLTLLPTSITPRCLPAEVSDLALWFIGTTRALWLMEVFSSLYCPGYETITREGIAWLCSSSCPSQCCSPTSSSALGCIYCGVSRGDFPGDTNSYTNRGSSHGSSAQAAPSLHRGWF